MHLTIYKKGNGIFRSQAPAWECIPSKQLYQYHQKPLNHLNNFY